MFFSGTMHVWLFISHCWPIGLHLFLTAHKYLITGLVCSIIRSDIGLVQLHLIRLFYIYYIYALLRFKFMTMLMALAMIQFCFEINRGSSILVLQVVPQVWNYRQYMCSPCRSCG
jgi:hypothetical protein